MVNFKGDVLILFLNLVLLLSFFFPNSDIEESLILCGISKCALNKLQQLVQIT